MKKPTKKPRALALGWSLQLMNENGKARLHRQATRYHLTLGHG